MTKEINQNKLPEFDEIDSQPGQVEKRHITDSETRKGTHVLPAKQYIFLDKNKKQILKTLESVYCEVVERDKFKPTCWIRIADYTKAVFVGSNEEITLSPETEYLVELWNLVELE